eukprot:g45616.t1
MIIRINCNTQENVAKPGKGGVSDAEPRAGTAAAASLHDWTNLPQPTSTSGLATTPYLFGYSRAVERAGKRQAARKRCRPLLRGPEQGDQDTLVR